VEGKLKEFEVSLSVRNNLLKERRLSLGMTQRELSQSVGIGQNLYCEFESMRTSPIKIINVCSVPDCERKISTWSKIYLCQDHRERYGSSAPPRKFTWRDGALLLASYYNCDIQELFPDVILNVNNPKAVVKLDIEQVSRLGNLLDAEAADVPLLALPAEEEIIKLEEIRQLESFINRLPHQYQEVLKVHWGLGCSTKTLDEIGRPWGKSRERIRQLEGVAIGLLRKMYARES
jgi:Sigma-70, region 4